MKDLTDLKNYRGNKNIPGVYQWIINRIPVHTHLYEVFAGSAAITFHLPESATTVINDIDPEVTAILNCRIRQNTAVTNLDALQLLLTVRPGNHNTFVYCDPPYKLDTRGTERKIYKFEMSDKDHFNFLSVVRTVGFNCMISHYECDLYNKMLKGWNKEKRKVRYRGKTVQECIYYNYPKPTVLQTYKFVGSDCWDRQRVTRKINRLVNKLKNLPDLEKNAIISRVLESNGN